MPARPRQPRVQGPTAHSAVGLGLHLRLDLAGLVVRGLCLRCFCPADRGLAREQHHAYGLRARCAEAGFVRAHARSRSIGSSQRQGLAIPLHSLHRAAGLSPHSALSGQPWRQLRQHPGREHQWPVQGRTDSPPAPPGRPGKPWSWPPRNGFTGSTAHDCSRRLGASLRQRLRRTTGGNWPQRRRAGGLNLNQPASTIPGMVQANRL